MEEVRANWETYLKSLGIVGMKEQLYRNDFARISAPDRETRLGFAIPVQHD